MIKTVSHGPSNHYTALQGHPLLREKIAKNFSPLFNNRKIDPFTDVLVTTGACGALYSILMNFAGPGDEVLMFEPYFTIYVTQVEFSGAKLVTAPMFID